MKCSDNRLNRNTCPEPGFKKSGWNFVSFHWISRICFVISYIFIHFTYLEKRVGMYLGQTITNVIKQLNTNVYFRPFKKRWSMRKVLLILTALVPQKKICRKSWIKLSIQCWWGSVYFETPQSLHPPPPSFILYIPWREFLPSLPPI